MPDRNQSLQALFLRSKDSPSGDRILTMLTAEEGVIDAFVFGGARSSLRSSASPFVFARTLLYTDPVKRYRKLSDLTILETFSGLRESYAKLWSASAISELIVKTSGCGGEYGAVLELTLEALRILDRENDAKADVTLLAYLWKTLGIMGLQPDLETCIRCGKPLLSSAEVGGRGERGALRYSAASDGFLCDSCGGDGLSLGSKELLCLRDFSVLRLAECAALAPGDSALSSLKGIIYFLAQKAAEGTLLSLE